MSKNDTNMLFKPRQYPVSHRSTRVFSGIAVPPIHTALRGNMVYHGLRHGCSHCISGAYAKSCRHDGMTLLLTLPSVSESVSILTELSRRT